MFDKLFSPEVIEETLWILQNEIPLAVWETIYVTILATAFAIILGLPLGVLLVVGEKDGVRPLPKGVMHVLNIFINLLRSVPFLILMIMVVPLTRLIVGTADMDTDARRPKGTNHLVNTGFQGSDRKEEVIVLGRVEAFPGKDVSIAF